MTAVSKWCVQTNPRALEIHSEASRALPCCFNRPWPVEGSIAPHLLTMDRPHQGSSRRSRSLSRCGTNVNEVCRCFWEAHPGLEQKETVLGQQCFWCSYTHTLVLSYYTWFTVKGPLLPLHGAVIFKQSKVCPSSGTLSPQSQPIKVAALWLQLSRRAQELVPFEVFLQFLVAKWFCLKKKSTLYGAEIAQSFIAFQTHSQRK